MLMGVENDMAAFWKYKLIAVLIVARSEMRLESRKRRSISAGFKVKTTTTERMAMVAITIRSSIG